MFKISMKSIIGVAVFALALFGGVNAYEKSYEKRMNSEDSMLMLNIEALTQDGEGYSCSVTAKCFTSDSVEYGSVSCSGKKECHVYYGYVICDGNITSCT